MPAELAPAFYDRPLRRHAAFWRGECDDRPLLGCNIGMFAHDHCPSTMRAMPRGLLRPQDLPVPAFLEDCDRLYAIHRELGDDYPFVASPLVFVPWMEAIMGCEIVASPTSIWAKPSIRDLLPSRDSRRSGPTTGNAWVRSLIQLMERLLEHANGRYPVSATMLRGPADVIAAMMGADRFPLACVDSPETMTELAATCAEAFVMTAGAQLELLPDSPNGYMDGDRGFRVWAPGKLIWLQEDAMALLSPRLYRDIFLPVDRSIASHFDAVAFHLHGSALWASTDLCSAPEIDVMELNFEAAFSDREATFAACRQVAGRKPLVLWRLFGDDFWPWLDRVLATLSPRPLSVQVTVRDLAEGTGVTRGYFERTMQRP